MNKEKTDQEIFQPVGKKIIIAGKEIIIKPFVLRNRTVVIRSLFDIFVVIAKNRPELSTDDLKSMSKGFDLIPVLIDASEGKLIDIYEVATGQSKEWLLDNTRLKDEIAIIEAVMEINDIRPLLSQVKSLVQRINPSEKIS